MVLWYYLGRYIKKKGKDGFYADLIFIPNTVNAVTTMAIIPSNSFSMKKLQN